MRALSHFFIRRCRRVALATGLCALLGLATLATQITQAQTPPPVEPLVIVNDDEEKPFIERKKKGEFRARPIFSQRLSKLTYGIRDADTGEWLTSIYRINGGEDERDEGWEYDFDYPALDEQPELDPERTYLLVLGAQAVDHAEADHVLHHDPRAPAWRDLQQDSWARSIHLAGRVPLRCG